MSANVTGTINSRKFVLGLTDHEKHILVELLKNDLGTKFGTMKLELDELDTEIDTDVEVEEDDVINDLTRWEKESIWEDLDSEFGEECEECEDCLFSASTYTEQQLANSLTALWESRHLMTPDQLRRIEAMTREKFV